jgi:hypothetical protein
MAGPTFCKGICRPSRNAGFEMEISLGTSKLACLRAGNHQHSGALGRQASNRQHWRISAGRQHKPPASTNGPISTGGWLISTASRDLHYWWLSYAPANKVKLKIDWKWYFCHQYFNMDNTNKSNSNWNINANNTLERFISHKQHAWSQMFKSILKTNTN